MNNRKITAITGMGSISPLGSSTEEVWQSYLSGEAYIQTMRHHQQPYPAASLSDTAKNRLTSLIEENLKYRRLDKSVLMAIEASRQAIKQTGWQRDTAIGINIGSSRGATELFEKYHQAYLNSVSGKVPLLTSPTTTLGNISSWVARDLQLEGPLVSHSVTCSSALHGIGNALAWLRAGMAERFLCGGSEAPLTGFTLAQMKALTIYSKELDHPYPCRPCGSEENSPNTMLLGEGSAILGLEMLNPEEVTEKSSNILAIIDAFGYGIEQITHSTSISNQGIALQKSMKMALSQLPSNQVVDMILIHAPGTLQGDKAELTAIKQVFGSQQPILCSNKWFIGHTLGASAALSLEYALLILKHNRYQDFPYPVPFVNKPRPIQRIMINATGFGGNAASLIVSKKKQ